MIDNLAIRECLIRVARLAVGSPVQRAEYQVGHQVAEVQLPRDGHGVVAIDDELAAFDLECFRRMMLRGVQGTPIADRVAVKVGPLVGVSVRVALAHVAELVVHHARQFPGLGGPHKVYRVVANAHLDLALLFLIGPEDLTSS